MFLLEHMPVTALLPGGRRHLAKPRYYCCLVRIASSSKLRKHSCMGLAKVSALAFTPSHTQGSRDPVHEAPFVPLVSGILRLPGWHPVPVAGSQGLPRALMGTPPAVLGKQEQVGYCLQLLAITNIHGH